MKNCFRIFQERKTSRYFRQLIFFNILAFGRHKMLTFRFCVGGCVGLLKNDPLDTGVVSKKVLNFISRTFSR